MPRGKSILTPSSQCPGCKYKIPIYRNIPILSWFLLGGKCANCGCSISFKYPLTEFLGAVLGFISVLAAGQSDVENIYWARHLTLFWFLTTLIPIFVIDFKYMLLPDSITIGGIVVGFALSFLPDGIGFVNSLLGIAICGGGFFLFGFVMSKILHKEALGFGDVKLFTGFGAFMGATYAYCTLIIASFIALIIMASYRFFAHKDMKIEFPFGPFLGITAPIIYLWGAKIIDNYLYIIDRLFGTV